MKAEDGVWPLLVPEAALDADDEPQAMASKPISDAIAAARFIGIIAVTVACGFGYGHS